MKEQLRLSPKNKPVPTRRKLLPALLALALFLISTNVFGLSVEINDIYYNLKNGEAEVAPADYSGKISIPAKVNYNGTTYSVTSIGDKAFKDCNDLTRVIIPTSVTNIGDYAFFGCTRMGNVDLPYSIKSIGTYAFSECSSLDEVTSYIETPFDIEATVFSNISPWASLTIMYGTKEKYLAAKGWNVFSYFYDDIALIGGLRYSVDTEDTPHTAWVEEVPKWTEYRGAIEIPETLVIGEETFVVKGIDDGAFEGSSITSVTIPKTITSIDDGAFMDCSDIKAVKSFITSPFSLRKSVFQGIPSDAILHVPMGTKSEYLATEGWNMFSYIEEHDFQEGVYFDGETFFAPTIEDKQLLFQVTSFANKTCALLYPQEDALQGHVTIPEEAKGYKVIRIENSAFEGCEGLTGITIPTGVTSKKHNFGVFNILA